jgi:hypothetical protein
VPDVIVNNPAIVTGLVRAILAAAIVLGLNLTAEQEAAVIVVVSLIITVITARLTVPKSPTPTAPPAAIQAPPAAAAGELGKP